jgi:hypothetical protein
MEKKLDDFERQSHGSSSKQGKGHEGTTGDGLGAMGLSILSHVKDTGRAWRKLATTRFLSEFALAPLASRGIEVGCEGGLVKAESARKEEIIRMKQDAIKLQRYSSINVIM